MGRDPDVTAAPERVSDVVLEDLRSRLRATRRVALTGAAGWSRGTDPDYLDDLLSYWAERYDWRTHEERIRALPWVRHGGRRALHQPAGDEAPTVVLLHGWPDSFLRYARVLPLLADVNVVVPCLPGYPHGPAVTSEGQATRPAIARGVAALPDDLGYDRYVVSGGDIGGAVAEALAAARPDGVAALHLTDVPFSHLFTIDEAELSPGEREYLDVGRAWQATEAGYSLEQATKPHTLAVGLGDSPAGLAAWLVEKLRSWSDCGGDVESAFPRDDLLTWVTLYWVTGAIGSSFAAYADRTPPGVDRLDVPTAVTVFAHDLVRAPREFGERFLDIRVWTEEPRGGHFAAWERPERFVAGLREALAIAG